MKKYFVLLIALASNLAAFEQIPEWQQHLSQNQNTTFTESLFYTKFDTYSRFLKKDVRETEIATKYGIGWRYRKSSHGFSISFSGHEKRDFFLENIEIQNTIDTETGNVKVIRDRSLWGTYWYMNGQFMYHYYFNPSSTNSFYLGAGIETDRYAFYLQRKGTRLNLGFLTGLMAGGYQFQATDKMKSFVELQFGLPAYVSTTSTTQRTGYVLMESFAPTISVSIGVGY